MVRWEAHAIEILQVCHVEAAFYHHGYALVWTYFQEGIDMSLITDTINDVALSPYVGTMH